MWYAVSVIFHSIKTNGEVGFCEEIIYCIQPSVEEEKDEKEIAEQKALSMAKERNLSYGIASGDTLTWIAVGVSGSYCIEVEQLTDGLEIFSRSLRKSEADSLLTPFEDD